MSEYNQFQPEQPVVNVPEPQPVPQPEPQPVQPQAAEPVPAYQAQPNNVPPYFYAPYAAQVPPRPAPAPQPKPKKRSGMVWLIILIAVAVAITSSVVTGVVTGISSTRKMEKMQQTMQAQIDVMQDQIAAYNSTAVSGGQDLTPGQVYAQNVRAVVAVNCQVQEFDYYAGGYSVYDSFGSGFIISQDGYVLSNCHVVEGASNIWVSTVDGEEYVAELIGVDEANDVSLLKIKAEGLPYVELGNSDEVAVGDQVVAIGNPLGELTSTLTVGYVSAKDRIVTTDGTTINMLQTDAAINSGNSGGPLFDMQGKVIGITTAKYSGMTESGVTIEGIGFAIPIDDVISVAEDLAELGYVKSSYLGIMCRDVSQDAVRDGLPAGVYVEDVTKGCCAEAAGLQRQDIITAIGEYELTCVNDLTRALRKIEPGTRTSITVYRAGQTLELPITLDEKPVTEETEPAEPQVQPTQPQQESEENIQIPDFFRDFFNPFFGW